MSNTKKRAKDIAFDKERQKFQKEIKEHKETITSLNRAIQEKDSCIAELNSKIKTLEQNIAYLAKSGYTSQELDEHVQRTKKIANMFTLLNNTIDFY